MWTNKNAESVYDTEKGPKEGDPVNRQLATSLWLIPIGVVVSVLASLAVVWLLSEAVGFRFNPTLVAALSGSFSALMIGSGLWRSRA